MITANDNQSWLSQHSKQQLMGSDVAWLNEQRQAGLAQFEKVGLPGVRDEDWRYTNLRALKSNDFSVSSSNSLTLELAETSNPRLVFVDGHLDIAASTGLSEHVSSLKDSLDIVKGILGSTLPKDPHGFTALNSAYAQDGYVIHLKPGQVLDGVLEVFFVSQTADAVSHTRNLIITEANTQCTVVERHIGAHGAVYLNNIVTEIIAGNNAHVDHYKIQQESDEAFHMGGVFISQASSSQVKNHNIALSGLVTRNDVCCNLLGQGAHMEMNGLVLGQGRQHIDNHTEVNHAVPNCTSDEYYKTVLDDHSRSIFRGRIIVAEDAQQTNADQQSNNLLLSKNAEADCKPQLEIYADDVKCSHGVTVGQLNPVSLFYLKSRGINADSANALLTFAFANEVIERVKVPSVREELTKIMAGELLSDLEDLV
jgi:Fe-S cluster assembly protein SufD